MKVQVEQKEVTVTTQVFAVEFTQNEVDVICAALERAINSYNARRVTPEVVRLQRVILKALKAEEYSQPFEIDDEEEEGDED